MPRIALHIERGADPRTYFSPPPCGGEQRQRASEARSASGGGPSLTSGTAPHPDRLASLGSPTSPQGGGYVDDVWLEIGFGAGEHLLEQARTNPRIGLIGAEPYEAGVAKLLSKLSLSPIGGEGRGEGVNNLRIHEGDARDIIEALPEASLGRVFILFPDPWPKTRHHKRRFIQTEMLDALARAMKPGAELRFASDDAGYVEWTLERAMAHPAFAWTVTGPTDWKTRPAGWPQTRYEAKALHGPPVYLRFMRS